MITLNFKNLYIDKIYSIAGPNRNLNLKKVSEYMNDYYFEETSFEKAQIKMEKEVLKNLVNDKTDLIVGGDLSNQLTSSTYSIDKLPISTLNVYSACASFIESLIVGGLFVDNNLSNEAISITSSHNLASERQFRYPVEYGTLRNENSTYTLTAAVGCTLKNKKTNIRIKSATIGYPVNLGINDPNYIGAIMAPSAGDVIYNHLLNSNLKPSDYDVIITGDLGKVGHKILVEYLNEEYNLKIDNLIDAGENIYKKVDEINDGASGPSVLPMYLFHNVLIKPKYKKILIVGTGSLHSKSLVNQKESIPGISHAISLEVI